MELSPTRSRIPVLGLKVRVWYWLVNFGHALFQQLKILTFCILYQMMNDLSFYIVPDLTSWYCRGLYLKGEGLFNLVGELEQKLIIWHRHVKFAWSLWLNNWIWTSGFLCCVAGNPCFYSIPNLRGWESEVLNQGISHDIDDLLLCNWQYLC